LFKEKTQQEQMYFKLIAKKLENYYMEVQPQELVDIVISRVWL